MRIIRGLVVALVFAGAPAFGAEGHGTPLNRETRAASVSQEIESVEGLGDIELLRWTQETLRRFHRANLELFQSAEVYHRYDWGKRMVEEIVTGGERKVLAIRYLVQELSKAEDAAFNKLQGDFKRTVLTSLESDPDEQKRRLETWDQLFNHWQASGGTPQGKAQLIVWLREAIQKQRLGAVPLPPFPELAPREQPEDSLLGRFRSPRSGRVEAGGPEAVDWAKWKIEQMVSIMRKPLETPPDPLRANSRLVAEPRGSSVPRDGLAPKALDAAETVHIGHSALAFPERKSARRSQPRIAVVERASRLVATLGLFSAKADIPGGLVETPIVQRGSGVDRGAEDVAAAAPRKTNVSPPARSGWGADDGGKWPRPTLSASQPASVASRIPAAPDPFASMDRQPARKSPSVNVQKLNTLVRGFNLAVKELESTLDAPRDWNARNLTPIVAQLRDLTQRERDLRIFEQLVPADEHEYLERISPLNPSITRIAAAIYEARNRAMRLTGMERIRVREIQDLQDLSRQLARLATAP